MSDQFFEKDIPLVITVCEHYDDGKRNMLGPLYQSEEAHFTIATIGYVMIQAFKFLLFLDEEEYNGLDIFQDEDDEDNEDDIDSINDWILEGKYREDYYDEIFT